jgi:hypothetical protein
MKRSLLDTLRKETTVKAARTENGMVAHTSTLSACLDLFGALGSARGWLEEDILALFARALGEDPIIALKILFWARDVRMGAGERRVFRVCLNYLNDHHQDYFNKNIDLVPEFGRWDDLFGIDNRLVLQVIVNGLENKDGLLAKWLPRKGAFANTLRKGLGMTPKQYRKMVVGMSSTVEQLMCAGKWDEIDYSQVPSQAMLKYRTAFYKHDEERFQKYLDSVQTGEVKINAGAMYPYQLYDAVRRAGSGKALKSVEAQWNALPNFLEGNEEMILPVCDVSGSMNSLYGVKSNITPMSVSVSLGMYISERNIGPFQDAFMTFSMKPEVQILKGGLVDRCHQLLKAHWDMNTDLEAVFRVLLRTAVKYATPVEQMPTMLLIISDMQFDSCIENPNATASEMIREQYEKAGYKLPKLVFWNVNARPDQSPVLANESGTALISGCSPSILKSVLSGRVVSPIDTMLETINAERYERVTI